MKMRNSKIIAVTAALLCCCMGVARAQQEQQQQQQGQQGLTTGSLAQDPIRLDVGENRFFYLPPLNETRLVSDEVVLQMPCNVPKAELEEIIKQHDLTTIASQCLQEGGNAAFRIAVDA